MPCWPPLCWDSPEKNTITRQPFTEAHDLIVGFYFAYLLCCVNWLDLEHTLRGSIHVVHEKLLKIPETFVTL
jgi:hypothetical protein